MSTPTGISGSRKVGSGSGGKAVATTAAKATAISPATAIAFGKRLFSVLRGPAVCVSTYKVSARLLDTLTTKSVLVLCLHLT